MTARRASAAKPRRRGEGGGGDGSLLLDLGQRTVASAWVNASGHMRAARYVVLFEEAIASFLDRIGCSAADVARTQRAPVLAEMHVCYRRELAPGDRVAMSLQVLDIAARSAHVFLRMVATDGSELAATVELMIVNLDLAMREPRAWSASQLATLAAIAEAHAAMPRPETAGRGIARR